MGLDHEQARLGAHRRAAAAQDREAPFVVPVVDDALDDVGVGARRHRLEEVAAHELEPAEQALFFGKLAAPSLAVRQIEDLALQLWILGEDRHEQRAVSAAHVHNRAHAREVEGARHRARVAAGELRHRGVEDRVPSGSSAIHSKVPLPESRAGCGLTRFHGVEQAPPSRPDARATPEQRPVSHRIGRVGAQVFAEGCELELAVVFDAQLQCDHSAQQAAHGRCRHVDGGGQVLGFLPAGGQVVGQAEHGRHVDHLRPPAGHDQVRETKRERNRIGCGLAHADQGKAATRDPILDESSARSAGGRVRRWWSRHRRGAARRGIAAA